MLISFIALLHTALVRNTMDAMRMEATAGLLFFFKCKKYISFFLQQPMQRQGLLHYGGCRWYSGGINAEESL